MTIRLGDGLICYGATLARKMPPRDQALILSHVPADREIGSAHVIMSKSSVPGAVDVHFLPDRLSPDQCIAALATALERMVKLHGKAKTSPVIIEQADALTVREQAESIVDFIRAGRFVDGVPRFDNPREVCVRMLTIAFATVAVTPGALARG